MSIAREKHDTLVDNIAKLTTAAVIALGFALIVALLVYTI